MGRSIFDSIGPTQIPVAPPNPGAGQFLNPFQRVQQVMSVMNNPIAFLKQKFPDIPDEIMNDPNQIMQYLQRTRGITDQDIQQVQAQVPGMQNGGIPWQGR